MSTETRPKTHLATTSQSSPKETETRRTIRKNSSGSKNAVQVHTKDEKSTDGVSDKTKTECADKKCGANACTGQKQPKPRKSSPMPSTSDRTLRKRRHATSDDEEAQNVGEVEEEIEGRDVDVQSQQYTQEEEEGDLFGVSIVRCVHCSITH
jgi:hypothetical protein